MLSNIQRNIIIRALRIRKNQGGGTGRHPGGLQESDRGREGRDTGNIERINER